MEFSSAVTLTDFCNTITEKHPIMRKQKPAHNSTSKGRNKKRKKGKGEAGVNIIGPNWRCVAPNLWSAVSILLDTVPFMSVVFLSSIHIEDRYSFCIILQICLDTGLISI